MAIKKKTLIVILGPTAVGKTDLSIQLAQKLETVIISADSRQFYKELNIGTAKPSPEQLKAVKHYFVDFISITEDYDAATFEQKAVETIHDLFQTKDAVILTGGSGLYINAICKGFDALPPSDPEIRNELNKQYQIKGLEYLNNMLLQKDPEYYNEVDLHNPQRVIRALEVCLSSGKKYSSFRTQRAKERNFNILWIGLSRNREELYSRINYRVDEMVKAGLIEEARTLLPFKKYNALQTVGYNELMEYFDGNIHLDTAIELIKQNTRRYAKRQLTWFRKNKEIHWFHPEEKNKIYEFIQLHLEKVN